MLTGAPAAWRSRAKNARAVSASLLLSAPSSVRVTSVAGAQPPGGDPLRVRYFFSKRPYVPVPADSPEGLRLAMTLKAAGNYGYANRVAVLEIGNPRSGFAE